jgi:hypothetical protein
MRWGAAGRSALPRDPQRHSCWEQLPEEPFHAILGGLPRMVVEHSAIALSGCLRVVQRWVSAGSVPGGLGPGFPS